MDADTKFRYSPEKSSGETESQINQADPGVALLAGVGLAVLLYNFARLVRLFLS